MRSTKTALESPSTETTSPSQETQLSSSDITGQQGSSLQLLRKAKIDHRLLTARDVMRLQHTLGNKALQRLMASTSAQRAAEIAPGPSGRPIAKSLPTPSRAAGRPESASLPDKNLNERLQATANTVDSHHVQRLVGFEFEMSIPVSPITGDQDRHKMSKDRHVATDWQNAMIPMTPKTVVVPEGENDFYHVKTDTDNYLTKAMESAQSNLEIITTPLDEHHPNWQGNLTDQLNAINEFLGEIREHEPARRRQIFATAPSLMIGYPKGEGDEKQEAARREVKLDAFAQATMGVSLGSVPNLFQEQGQNEVMFGDAPSRETNGDTIYIAKNISNSLANAGGEIQEDYEALTPYEQRCLEGLFVLLVSYIRGGAINEQEQLLKNIVGVLSKTDMAGLRRDVIKGNADAFLKNYHSGIEQLMNDKGVVYRPPDQPVAMHQAGSVDNPLAKDMIHNVLTGSVQGDLITSVVAEGGRIIPPETVGPNDRRTQGPALEFRAIPGRHAPGGWKNLMEFFILTARDLNSK